ncbi:molybdate ABC transporter substrate-binding protein [Cellulomonas sp. P22]|uniref:molybdate ABC transporter substrate-binding protein n=1 Tax=Cellulomonas sp. P22 TaxID=3373189 RepID=UPI0037AE82E0
MTCQSSVPARRPRARAVLLVGALVLGLSACAGGTTTTAASDASTPGATTSPSAEPLTGQLRIMAAASLRASFDELVAEFVADNPEIDTPVVTYDGSSTLVMQLVEGAEAEIFASADQATMTKALDADLVPGEAEQFATNTLEIAVAAGNPAGVTSLADLASADLQVVLCAPEVPCGAAAAKALTAAGVTVTPVSEEQNVTAVLTKVAMGEADAGLVYRTDVLAADGDVEGVEFPEASQAVNSYFIASLQETATSPVATAFVEFVLSARGQEILASHGFSAA